ncbi:death domain-containing protein CRADD-like protein, partial [Leptotrombidium deliense]
MDSKEKRKLIDFHEKLVDEVKVLDVLPKLISERIFTISDGEEITAHCSPHTQMQKLLFLLPSRGANAFTKFVDSLKEDYSWLAEKLTEETAVQLNCSQNYHELEVNNEVIEVLKTNCQVVKRWATLAHALGISSTTQNQIQIQSNIFMWDLERCVVEMFEKWKSEKGKAATVGLLLNTLRKEHFNDAA